MWPLGDKRMNEASENMGRVLDLLERWLLPLAGLSGVVIPVSEMARDWIPADPGSIRGLDDQLLEILDFVSIQEQMWPRDRGSQSLSIRRPHKPRPG
jgi:hypothetical protein